MGELISKKTLFEGISTLLFNLSSGWIGVVVVAPGFFGVSNSGEFFTLLWQNLPLGILSLILALILSEQAKKS